MKRRDLIIGMVFVVLTGCNDSFDPKGEFQDSLVVFAILTTVKDTQFVRLYRTYDPPGFNPLEHTTDNAVVDAQVSISSSSIVRQFHDTTIVRKDTSRYASNIRAYVAYQFPVERGETYTLDIETNSGDAIASSLVVPQPAIVTLSSNSSAALQNPISFRDEFITLSSRLSAQTRGFQVRAFLEYDVDELKNGVYIRKREEIPAAIRDFVDCHTFVPQYHALERRKANQPELTTFEVMGYMATLAKIWDINNSFDVRMRRVVFELTEFDPALYSYVSIANGFRDEFSIRTDEPDYSNIPGGFGIFGAMAKQSLAVDIPETVGIKLGCQGF